ncbi:hypothetical protein LLG46_05860 [bacterium]|nr:hypothetical protein [bacterium]
MTNRIAYLLCVCLICSVMISSMAPAQTRTTPVEVANTPTVEISTTNNLVQTQAKSLKVSPLSTSLTIAANSSVYIPDVDCSGYKEARVMMYSSMAYTVAQEVSLTFYYDAISVGITPWWSSGSQNQLGFQPICSSFCAIIPVMGNVLKIKLTNSSDSAITINPSSCWVYLVN